MNCATCKKEIEPLDKRGRPRRFCSPACGLRVKPNRFKARVWPHECPTCHRVLPKESFNSRNGEKYTRSYCIDCQRDKYSEWRNKKNYGLTSEEIRAMIEKVGHKCEVCGEENRNRGRGTGLHVDHDHNTGKVRGILCVKCNTGIGSFGDDKHRLYRAITYLEHTAARAAGGL